MIIMMINQEDYDLEALQPSKDLCKDCLNWKDFKEKCWYHWQNKKECSQKLKI
jgi:hypothetical protein